MKKLFSYNPLVLQRALRMSITLMIAAILASFLHYTHSYWLPLSAAIIMQPTIGGTLRRGMQRSLGTLIGILIGGLLLWFSQDNLYIQAPLLIIVVFIAYYLQAFNQINYGIFVIPLTIMVLILLTSLVQQPLPRLLLERGFDTIAASFLVIFTSYLLLPNSTRDEAEVAIQQVTQTIQKLLLAIAAQNITPTEYHLQVLAVLQNNQRIWPEWIYENYFQAKDKQLYQQVILSSEHCFETLAALKWQMEEANAEQKQLIARILTQTAQLFASSSTAQTPREELIAVPDNLQIYVSRLQQAAEELNTLRLRISAK